MICLALPSSFKVASLSSKPISLLITVPPVKMAISSSIAFLLSPKPGALTATQLNTPFNLFTIMVDNASPSISSAIISNFKPFLTTCSSKGSSS